jgi:hypothetical protein
MSKFEALVNEPARGTPDTAPITRSRIKLRFLKSTSCPTVACHPLLALDRALEEAGVPFIVNAQAREKAFLAKIGSKFRIIRNLRRSQEGPVFVSFMGFSESKTVPFSSWNEILPYCFDCWPNQYERWLSFFKRHRIRLAFFSARMSAQHFASAIPGMRSTWLPEATDPLEYCASRSWRERDIDVLELGRKNETFHCKIVKPLAERQRTHLYERVQGEIIFPDRAALIEGLARSKISICFPCSQTHPARSGPVETVTHRYFESMASKCLVVGHAPQELIDLFGYDPVIEMQDGDAPRLDSILNSLSSFDELVERNYRRLFEVGTWQTRVATVLDVVRRCCFFN